MYHDPRLPSIPHFKSVLIPIVCMKSGFCTAPLDPGGAAGTGDNERALGQNKTGLGYLLFPVITITGNSESNKINDLRIRGALGGRLIQKIYQEPRSEAPGARYPAHGPGS